MPRPGNFGGQEVTQDHSKVSPSAAGASLQSVFSCAQAVSPAATARPPTNSLLFICGYREVGPPASVLIDRRNASPRRRQAQVGITVIVCFPLSVLFGSCADYYRHNRGELAPIRGPGPYPPWSGRQKTPT